MPDNKYTVTVYVAAPGTPLLDDAGKQKWISTESRKHLSQAICFM